MQLTRLFRFNLCLVALLFSTSNSLAANCANFGARCTEFTPFCNKNGYCTKDPIDAFLSQGCNPDASYPNACVPDPSCKSFKEEFTNPTSAVYNRQYLGDPDKQTFISDYENFDVANGNLNLYMKYSPSNNRGLLTRLISTRYVHYGNFTARLKTSNGRGLVNSFIFKTSADSDTIGDEIDFEWTFEEDSKITQTNYFVNGVIDYTKGVPAMMDSNSYDQFHTYTMVYEPTRLLFLVDDKVVRTVLNNCTSGSASSSSDCAFPNQKGRLFLSIWDTCNGPEGTTKWAHGPSAWCSPTATQESKNQVFRLTVDYVEVKCMQGYEDSKPPTIPKVNGVPTTSFASPGSTNNKSSGFDPIPPFSGASFILVLFISFLFLH